MKPLTHLQQCRELLVCCKRLFSSKTRDVVELSYSEFGRSHPGKKPLVMLHGLFGSQQNFRSLAKQISSDGRKVITVCNRNHGYSQQSSEMNYNLMAMDLEVLLDKLKLDEVVLLGHSMGGKIVMMSALTCPDRVSGLIVVDVSPSVSPALNLETYARKMRDIQFEQGVALSQVRRDTDTQLKTVVQIPGVRQFLLTNIVEVDGYVKWRLNLDSIIANFHHIAGFPQFDATYEKDTLFIGGSKSQHISGDRIFDIKRHFPKCEIKMVEGASHWVHSDKPKEFIDLVQMFFQNKQL